MASKVSMPQLRRISQLSCNNDTRLKVTMESGVGLLSAYQAVRFSMRAGC
jgi:hypothetical protein